MFPEKTADRRHNRRDSSRVRLSVHQHLYQHLGSKYMIHGLVVTTDMVYLDVANCVPFYVQNNKNIAISSSLFPSNTHSKQTFDLAEDDGFILDSMHIPHSSPRSPKSKNNEWPHSYQCLWTRRERYDRAQLRQSYHCSLREQTLQKDHFIDGWGEKYF